MNEYQCFIVIVVLSVFSSNLIIFADKYTFSTFRLLIVVVGHFSISAALANFVLQHKINRLWQDYQTEQNKIRSSANLN